MWPHHLTDGPAMKTNRFRSPWLLMAGAWACLGAAALTGCASTGFATDSGRNRQIGLTGLMAVDTAQTVTIGRSSDCLYEANPIAAAVFGSATPSPQRVLLTNTVYIAAHWLLGSYLDRKANPSVDFSVSAEQDIARANRWKTAQRVYQIATFVGHGAAVMNNEARRIKPFSSYECGGAR